MRTHSASLETATKLRSLLFDEFGKRIYRDQNPNNVSRRYLLTDAKLRDLLHTGAAKKPIQKLLPHLISNSGKVHKALSPSELQRYLKLARLGRCVLRKRDYDANFFAHESTIELARRLRDEPIPLAA